MGYFKDGYELAEPVRSGGRFEYFYFGFWIAMCPIGLPLYWLGRIGAKVYGGMGGR